MKIVHVVADYGAGDLAFSEMISALARRLPADYCWQPTPVPSFDTIGTGFIVAQLGLQTEELSAPGTIIYANCAPRRDLPHARVNNEGEGILYGIFSNGIPFLVVNSGYSLSFVKNNLKELWSVHVERGKSQFRSRDIFPPLVGKIAAGELDFRNERLDPQRVIPDPPKGVVAYCDSFGNLKTSYRKGDFELEGLKPGDDIRMRINGVERAVKVANGSFNVQEGEIAFSAGSSGHEHRYWEIFRRGDSAFDAFGCPHTGSIIQIVRG